MSQENVEIVRSLYVGDPSRFFELLDDEVEVVSKSHPLPDHPELIRGKSAVIDFYRHYWGTWDDDYSLEAAEVTDVGANRILVVHHETGRGRGSGVPFERRWVVIYTLVAGKLARVQAFSTRQEALEAAGLTE
ncbi:MAG: nuclear transport factor 2 family protein [Solirubrobacterales bacterium]